MIEDLSFSKIVDIVQGDKKVAGELLIKIAEEKEIIDNNYKDVEIKLNQLKTRQLQLKEGALLVLKHIDIETPLAVPQIDFIVVVTDNNISIERNVL